MDVFWTLIAVIFSLILYLFMKIREKHKYWERKGVIHLKPLPIFGSSLPVMLLKSSSNEIYKQLYTEYSNEKAVGLYEFQRAVLVLRDPKLIEKVLVKDFQYFTDHATINEKNDLFRNGLFQLKGNKWRAVRNKISPTFTSGKLKLMLNGMLDCTEGMISKIKNNINTDYEVKEALSSYTMDVIANVVFGIKITDENARKEFKNKGSQFFNVTPKVFFKIVLMQLFPKLATLFGLSFINEEISNYFTKIIKTTLEQRKNAKQQRNDYVELLLKLKQKGTIEIQTKDDDEDSYLEIDDQVPIENIEITEGLLIGQAFQFLTAGFEPVFNTLMFIMFELARYPETQERARQEVKDILAKHESYSYEALKEMTYLEQCVQETLRLHPLTAFLFRECSKRYVTEDGIEIDKGVRVIIPLNSIHMDPQYYPDPETFMPERLPPNSIRNNYTYMPFGDGPRICIGLRFALLELKLGMAKILNNFKFTLSPKTKVPLDYNKIAFIPIPTTKILFNITPI